MNIPIFEKREKILQITIFNNKQRLKARFFNNIKVREQKQEEGIQRSYNVTWSKEIVTKRPVYVMLIEDI